MLEKMKNAWRIPELRKKIIYTFGMLLVYRLLCVIPVPGIDIGTVAAATGAEYKDGAHLHFEVLQEGSAVDPASFLTMEEK